MGRLLRAALCGIALVGCEGPTGPSVVDDTRPDVREWVDGGALGALDRDGRFVLPSPELPPAPGLTSANVAADLGLAALRGILDARTIPGTMSIADFMEERHGGAIPWSQVRTGWPLAYLAESPFEPPADSAFITVRRRFGSYHVLGLYAEAGQVGSVAVTSRTAGFGVDEGGRLLPPPPSEPGGQSGVFRFQGVHRANPHHYPLHPEEAVAVVGSRTGARVVEVPLLLQVPQVWPQGALWRLVLDREVPFTPADGGGTLTSSSIHVGTDPAGDWIWAVPDPVQPPSETFRMAIPAPGPCPCPLVEQDVVVPVRDGLPTRFIQVRQPG